MKNFNAVNNVLNRVMSSLGLDKRLREHTFLTLWQTFVPGNIGDRSRALFIDLDRNVVVAVADASTGQELSLMKSKIMSKLAPAARSLGIELRGIRLDLKHYHTGMPSYAANVPSQEPVPKPSEKDLESVELTEPETAQIENLRGELAAKADAKPDTNARILRMFEREIRMRRWREKMKFPTCPSCGQPVERFHKKDSGEAVCLACLFV